VVGSELSISLKGWIVAAWESFNWGFLGSSQRAGQFRQEASLIVLIEPVLNPSGSADRGELPSGATLVEDSVSSAVGFRYLRSSLRLKLLNSRAFAIQFW
jgi:hypothetical protein